MLRRGEIVRTGSFAKSATVPPAIAPVHRPACGFAFLAMAAKVVTFSVTDAPLFRRRLLGDRGSGAFG